jgi:hypothetical protein
MEEAGSYMVFNPEWRRRTMELLLSRPRVLELLNDKNYPTVTKLPSGISMNFDNLLNIIYNNLFIFIHIDL